MVLILILSCSKILSLIVRNFWQNNTLFFLFFFSQAVRSMNNFHPITSLQYMNSSMNSKSTCKTEYRYIIIFQQQSIVKTSIMKTHHASYNDKYQRQSPKASSHFLGLECVLDKYQHENQMLCQKVSFLLQENKRLKMGPNNHQLSSNKRDEYNEYKFDRRQNHIYESSRSRRIAPSLDLKASMTKYRQENSSSRLKNYNQGSGRNKQDFMMYDPSTTERKFNYISKSKEILQNRINRNLNKESYLPAHERRLELSAYNNQQTERVPYYRNERTRTEPYSQSVPKYQAMQSFQKQYNDSMKIKVTSPSRLLSVPSCSFTPSLTPQLRQVSCIKIQKQPIQARNKINKNQQINKFVYLEGETILFDQESCEKLPMFVEASFGNADSKISCIDSRSKNKQFIKILESSTKNSNVSFSTCNKKTNFTGTSFKLEKTQQQKTKILTNSRAIEPKIEDKQNINEVARKTNHPYTKSDFKLLEPKTQLTKILLPDRKKPQSKQEILSSVTSTQGQQLQMNKAVLLPKSTQISKNIYPCKKTFLNVVSRKPKPSLFLK